MTDKHNNYLDEMVQLIVLTFDGKVSDDQFEYLEAQLKCNSKARECFLKMLTIYTAFSDYNNSGILFGSQENDIKFDHADIANFQKDENNEELDINVLLKLARGESTVPEVELPKQFQPEPNDTIKETQSKQEIKKQSKLYYYALAAAVVIVFSLIIFSPKPGYETATLVSTLDAQWENIDLERGYRFVVGENHVFRLNKGFAEILFDNNTFVTIEAPTEFIVKNDCRLEMKHGRIYANVPKAAIGFTVKTPNSTIVDLGTEFGVESYSNKVSELYVLKGKVALGSGSKESLSAVTLEEGSARKVTGVEGEIGELAYDSQKFVRRIDSRSNLVWRGESLKLTDYISGGDGFGNVKEFGGIDYKTGSYITKVKQDGRASDSEYHSVPFSRYIDGVFVPDKEGGNVKISSDGYRFLCPKTSGIYTHETVAYRGDIGNWHETIPDFVQNGVEYNDNNIMVLHSNGGITFDLEAIRNSVHGMKLGRFKAYGGITEAKNNVEQIPCVDFWVLVDGEVRYQVKSLKVDTGTINIDIDLSGRDRFLTFIVTDGIESLPENYEFPAVGNDFLHLVDPVITLEADSINY